MPARQLWVPGADDALDDLASIVMRMSPTEIEAYAASLDPDDLTVLELALAQRAALGWRSDPATMAAYLTGGKIRLWRYVRLLAEKFVDAVEGRSKNQIWNLPSRYGKSTLASRWGPVWCFDKHPEANIILVSYGDQLADENAVAVRDLLEEHADVLRTRLRRDRRRADRFVTEHGGGLLAAGIDSSIAGFGAGNGGGIVVDDPLKNWQEAHSEARRRHVWDQMRAVVFLRRDDENAWKILCHTRWHAEDPTGMILKARLEDEEQEEWELVRLPALAEAFDPNSSDPLLRTPDPLDRAPGEPLEPEKFPEREVRSTAVMLGTYLASGLEQQRPSPEEGGELRRDWWKFATTIPAKFDDAISSWDMKLKDKESGDYVVGQAWGRTGSDFWLVEQLRGQWNLATVKLAVVLLSVRHPYLRRHYIENTGNGPEVMEQLRAGDKTYVVSEAESGRLGMTDDERAAVQKIMRRGMTALLPVNVKGSKTVRARAVSGILEGGHVHLRDGDPEGLKLVDEAAAFPNGEHDDQVDAWSQAISKLGKGGASIKASTGKRPEPKAGTRQTTIRAGRVTPISSARRASPSPLRRR